MDVSELYGRLTQALWDIECSLDFHADEEYRDGFPGIQSRTAIAEARQLSQALSPPVVLQEVRKAPEEYIETLRINVSSIGERSVSTVNVVVPREESRRTSSASAYTEL